MEDEVGSSSHVQSQDHVPKAERESRSVHEHHQHNHPSAQPKMTTTTLTAATSSMMPAMKIYNVMFNLIQQLHKQANQPA
jgi:hypothetical protein